MLNHEHTSPPSNSKKATIWRIKVECPTHSHHTIYLTLYEDPHMSDGFLNWLGAQIALATGTRVFAEPIIEADLDTLPF